LDDALTSHNKICLLLLTVLLVSVSLLSIKPIEAQNVKRFSPQDVFEIPAVNGSISFSVNGTYTSAILENDTWVFNNLNLRGSRFSGNLKFSAKNCNVTIHTFHSGSILAGPVLSNILRYTVEGTGEQVMNLGLNSSIPTHVSEWSVINQDSTFFAEGKHWQLLPDDTIIVHDILGNLTVMRYNYGYHVNDDPFYLQHSVIILTGIVLTITVTITIVIKLKTKHPQRSLS
jgi:hypothetical protein